MEIILQQTPLRTQRSSGWNMLCRSIFTTTLTLLWCMSTTHASPKAAYAWSELKPGLMYATWSVPAGDGTVALVHAFDIDPLRWKLDVITADAQQAPEGSTAKLLAQSAKALISVNGGFFTAQRKSIGLLIQNGKQISPLHRTSWWSVFSIDGGVPRIALAREYVSSPATSMALQAGPRVAVDGIIPKLKPDVAGRTAVGITEDNRVRIAVTRGTPISLTLLGKIMSASRFDGGLECPNAMALDGGSSSQLYANIGRLHLDLPGMALIPNALGVFPQR